MIDWVRLYDYSQQSIILQFQMSADKPKRQFLKRGSRQFLANSSVKRQPYKLHSFEPGDDNSFEEIKVAPKKIPQKLSVEKQRPPQQKKQSRVVREPQHAPRVPIHTRPKKVVSENKDITEIPKWSNPVDQDEVFEVRGKRHQGSHQQYEPHPVSGQHRTYRNDSQNHDHQDEGVNNYLNKRKPKTVMNQASHKKQIVARDYSEEKNEYGSYKKPVNNYFKQQRQFKDEDDDEEEEKNIRLKQPQVKVPLRSINSNHDAEEFKPKKQEESGDDVDFNDDQDFDPNKQRLKYPSFEESKAKVKHQTGQEFTHRQKDYFQQSQEPGAMPVHKQVPDAPKRSRLVQQLFMSKNKTKGASSGPHALQGKLKVSDVPQSLKVQIIEDGIKRIRQKLDEEVQRINLVQKNLQIKMNKHDQELRQFQKWRKKEEDEMVEKKKGLEEEIKKEKAKIAKEQKVIKDSLDSRYTRKDKLEIEKYEKEISDLKEEKRKSDAKHKQEIQRLKQSLKSVTAKCEQYQSSILKRELYNIQSQEQEQTPKPTLKPKQPPLSLAPYVFITGPDPNISKMRSPDFSLNQLPLTCYSYQSNIFYQQYKSFPRTQQLQYQQQSGDTIRRYYKDKRIENQTIDKHIKQIFPNGYKIVHFMQGHIKQELPGGVIIYYDSTSNIVEFFLDENKRIHYFENQNQVEMKIEEKGVMRHHQIYNGRSLNNKYDEGRRP